MKMFSLMMRFLLCANANGKAQTLLPFKPCHDSKDNIYAKVHPDQAKAVDTRAIHI